MLIVGAAEDEETPRWLGFGAAGDGLEPAAVEIGGGGVGGGGEGEPGCGDGAGAAVLLSLSCFPRVFPTLPEPRRRESSPDGGSMAPRSTAGTLGEEEPGGADGKKSRARVGRKRREEEAGRRVGRGRIARAREIPELRARGAAAGARDRRMKRIRPQRGFHRDTEVLETALTRFTVMRRFYSLSYPFHAQIPFLLRCHHIKCA